jgi:hypothetical protein
MTSTRLHRGLAALLSAGALTAATAALLAAPTAGADSGFCGVRNDVLLGGGSNTYVVRNKCAADHKFKVKVHGATNLSECKTVPAGGFGYYAYPGTYDPNWSIVAC